MNKLNQAPTTDTTDSTQSNTVNYVGKEGTQPIQKSRLMYLDVDDTILVWSNAAIGYGAPRAADFINWALEHFEVRWLTMWCPSGKMRMEGCEELSYRLGGKISPQTFHDIVNPKGFIDNKTEGVDFNDPRPWVWVEDGIVWKEQKELTDRNMMGNFYKTNVSHNIVALQKTWRLLAERFDLPGPGKEYSKELDRPTTIITVEEIVDKFRNGKMQTHDENRPPELVLPQGWNW